MTDMARHCLQVSRVNTLDWPSRSHDLTPIEHLLDILGCHVCDLYPFSSATLQKLEPQLVGQWQRIPRGDMHRLLLCIHDRLTKCINKGGGRTR